MKKPTEQTFKRLFALSKNQCAFTGCTTAIVQSTGTVTGKVCHIKSKRPNNKPFDRYDPTQTDVERHAFENLILLCGVHHDIVDNELQTYTVEILKKLKEEHEQKGGTEFTPDDASVRKLIDSYLHIEASEEAMVIANSPSATQLRVENFYNQSPQSSPQVSLEFEFVMETSKEWRLHDPFPYKPPKKYTEVFLKIYAKNHRGGLAKIIQGFVRIPELLPIVAMNHGIVNGGLVEIEVKNKWADAPIHQFAQRPPPDWKPITSGMRLCLEEVSIHPSYWQVLNKVPGSILWQVSADDSDAIKGETKFADIPLIDQREESK